MTCPATRTEISKMVTVWQPFLVNVWLNPNAGYGIHSALPSRQDDSLTQLYLHSEFDLEIICFKYIFLTIYQ